MQTYKHWRLERDADDILWLYFDKQNASVNTLDRESMFELNDIIDSLENDTTHKGLIIASAKSNGYIAGANISEFNKFKDVNEAVEMLKKGQNIFGKINALKMPSVAMIDGFCVGGGTELVLGCHYRVAEDGQKTRIGLPEVKLGIQPGWGGSVRLPRLIGGMKGLNLVMTGSVVSAKVAAKMGIVDAAVPKRQLIRAAKYYILEKPARHEPTWFEKMTNKTPLRQILANIMRRKLRAKVNPEHYPAPFHVLDNWEKFGVEGQLPFDREAEDCAKLFFTDTSRNLVRVFFLQERLKGMAKESHFNPQRVHVIGAGTMGGDIAAWCAMNGMYVTLQDREPKFIAPAIKRAFALFKEKLKEPYLIQKAMDRLMPDVEGYGISRADVIVEAIFEDLTAKQNLFKSLELQAKPNAILATNTSSIPLDEINTVLDRRERLVGIHFFNPVSKMLLVEVVKGEHTDAATIEKAAAFVRKIDRLPLPVKSSPGFLVNRILMPYMLEAMQMLQEGIPAQVIDKAMLQFGMPMGPVTLADTVGLDIALSVAKYLSKYMNTNVPHRLTAMVEQGKLGRKTGEGFYKYKNGKQVKVKNYNYDKPLEDISDRLVLRMIDESFACLREGVVEDGDLVDAGMIFGTGFAPFRGGPIHYAKTKGIHELFQQYQKQRKERGEKIDMSKSWEMVEVSE